MNYQENNLIKILPNDDILSQCIHCGLCLSVCPTYELTKLETSSPRGRIRMIKSVAYGSLPVTKAFANEMNFCLDCQACETACPAGVKYGAMVEAARVEVDKEKKYGSFVERSVKKIALKYIISSKRNLKITARILYFYQQSGLQKFLHKIKFFNLFGGNISEIDLMSPKISEKFSDSLIEEISQPSGEEKNNVAFHYGCIMNVMFAEINLDTIEVLKAAGCKTITPKDQVCCGSLHAHHGEIETAKKLAKKNIDIFLQNNYKFLISNSAGCGAFMKEYVHLFKDDEEYSEKAKIFSEKVKDISEFLVDVFSFEKLMTKESVISNEPACPEGRSSREKSIPDEKISLPASHDRNDNDINTNLKLKPVNKNITYHDACHLVHTQKIFSQPREILQEIPQINIKLLEESTWCCGSAGFYNIIRYKDSMEVLKRKMENIKNTGAEVVVSGNPGCIAQINYGARKFNINVKAIHLITLIKESLPY